MLFVSFVSCVFQILEILILAAASGTKFVFGQNMEDRVCKVGDQYPFSSIFLGIYRDSICYDPFPNMILKFIVLFLPGNLILLGTSFP